MGSRSLFPPSVRRLLGLSEFFLVDLEVGIYSSCSKPIIALVVKADDLILGDFFMKLKVDLIFSRFPARFDGSASKVVERVADIFPRFNHKEKYPLYFASTGHAHLLFDGLSQWFVVCHFSAENWRAILNSFLNLVAWLPQILKTDLKCSQRRYDYDGLATYRKISTLVNLEIGWGQVWQSVLQEIKFCWCLVDVDTHSLLMDVTKGDYAFFLRLAKHKLIVNEVVCQGKGEAALVMNFIKRRLQGEQLWLLVQFESNSGWVNLAEDYNYCGFTSTTLSIVEGVLHCTIAFLESTSCRKWKISVFSELKIAKSIVLFTLRMRFVQNVIAILEAINVNILGRDVGDLDVELGRNLVVPQSITSDCQKDFDCNLFVLLKTKDNYRGFVLKAYVLNFVEDVTKFSPEPDFLKDSQEAAVSNTLDYVVFEEGKDLHPGSMALTSVFSYGTRCFTWCLSIIFERNKRDCLVCVAIFGCKYSKFVCLEKAVDRITRDFRGITSFYIGCFGRVLKSGACFRFLSEIVYCNDVFEIKKLIEDLKWGFSDNELENWDLAAGKWWG